MNMPVNMSDKEQIQMIKDWWKKNGTFVVCVIIFFLVVNIGVRFWRNHNQQVQERASTAYTQLINSQQQNKPLEVKLFAQDLMKNYKRSIYAGFAAMILAKNNIKDGKLDEAIKNLQWVIDKSSNDDLKTLARVRTARVLLAQNKPQQALAMLSNIDDKTYTVAVNEIKGDSMLAMGKKKEAVEFYKKAQSDSVTMDVKSPLLDMKVND